MHIDPTLVFAAVGISLAALLVFAAVRSNRPLPPAKRPTLRLPKSYRETSECFAWAIASAPGFESHGYTLEEGFAHLYHGLKLLEPRLKSDDGKELHALCKREVDESLAFLKTNDLRPGLFKLQDAWETFKKIQKTGLRRHEWEEPDDP